MQHAASVEIQRVFRGFLVRKRFNHQMRVMRMERNFRFFDKI